MNTQNHAKPHGGSRIEILRQLLSEGTLSTQDELREKLEKRHFVVNQSTISRDLRKLGAIKATDPDGQTVYRLPEENIPVATVSTIGGLVSDIQSNGAIIVIRTTPGSASLVARHLDHERPEGILGTIAGDDTIFVAPTHLNKIQTTLKAIRECF